MNCPCCGQEGLGYDQQNEPYICDHCQYITDDEGAYYCEKCDIHMDKTPVWYHSYMDGNHEIT